MTVVAWSRAAVAGPMPLLVALVASASTAALAVTTSMPAALATLLVVGWSTGAFFASANSAIQHRVTDRVRGRVLSVYSMIFAGTTPIGGLFVAAVASDGGISMAMAAAGGISLAIGLVLAMPVLRTLAISPLTTASAPALDRPAS
jgi:sugar phosphate permease